MQENPSLDPEKIAIARSQAGESSAFVFLIEKYQQSVFAHVFRRIGSQEIAEEMTQEVFLKAYAQLKNFRGEARFSTWLFQISLNLCRDYWKGKARYQSQTLSLEEHKLEFEGPAFLEQNQIDAQQNLRLRQMVGTLPPKYQEALILRFFDELSYEEIAAILGKKVSNVKMRVLRGLALLRKKWEEA